MPAHGFRAFPLAALRRLFEVTTEFHLTEDPLALHFLFQGAEGLIDIVVANRYVHGRSYLLLQQLVDFGRKKPTPRLFRGGWSQCVSQGRCFGKP